jgi:hypothetical protein
LIPGSASPETEKAMNYYLTSQLVADRQAALAADLTHRAQLKEARAARRPSAASASAVRPARTRWLFLARLAHAGA